MPTCDIFCKVIDNYGDAGIAWRLARGLSDAYGFDVRLSIDDVRPLAQLAPEYSTTKLHIDNLPHDGRGLTLADLVIECLGAVVPGDYVRAMVDRTRTGRTPPVWLRYEYLTAEDWAVDVHQKPSPHPQYPELKRYFFIPGFKVGTGGLLFSESMALQACTEGPAIVEPDPRVKPEDLSHISGDPICLMFTYPHPALKSVYDFLIARAVRVDLPPGAAASAAGLAPTVAFRPQQELDQILSHYNYVFVRGEDSISQAVAAGVPAVWHIYPQDGDSHYVKLAAFLDWYLDGLEPEAAAATRALYAVWNNGAPEIVPALEVWLDHQPALWAQAQKKALEVRARRSALDNLVDFYRRVG